MRIALLIVCWAAALAVAAVACGWFVETLMNLK